MFNLLYSGMIGQTFLPTLFSSVQMKKEGLAEPLVLERGKDNLDCCLSSTNHNHTERH